MFDRAIRAALTGKHDTLVRRAHQMLNAALRAISVCCVRRINDRPPASRMI